jgi:hypothetical protein
LELRESDINLAIQHVVDASVTVYGAIAQQKAQQNKCARLERVLSERMPRWVALKEGVAV